MSAERHSQLSFGPVPLKTLQTSQQGPDIRAVADAVKAAIRESGLSQKEAAYRMGISEQQLSNQLTQDDTRREQFSLWKAIRLGPAFWRKLQASDVWLEFMEAGADFYEERLEQASDAELGRAVRAALWGRR